MTQIEEGDGMRTGSELLQATKPFVKEDRARSWRYLLETLALIGLCLAVVALSPWWSLKILASLLAGLIQIRLFIIYHDYLHGAILRKSPAASRVMGAVGIYMLAVRSVWKETHNFHHKNNSKMVGSSVGSFPVLTLRMWRLMDEKKRRMYRLVRHPVTIFLGYLPVFAIGMSLSPFKRDKKQHWAGPVSLALHIAALVALGVWLGWGVAFLMVVVPLLVAHGLGTYLFFAQHNFPDMKLKGRRSWDYTYAALRSSSMFDMSPVMHWFTGNIGYHHVHHLNHRIPFYRLPEAMAAVPELQSPGRTSWRLSDMAACLRLAVWDPSQDRMLTYAEIQQAENQRAYAS